MNGDIEFDITTDSNGTLLTVDGSRAKSIGQNKYKVEGKTFWYYPDTQKLRRFDLNPGVGNFYFNCR